MECLRNKVIRMLVDHANYVINNVLVQVNERKMFFPGGHNGPYLHPETPVRNTSHFIVLLSNILNTDLDLKSKISFEITINRLYSYLVDQCDYFVNGQYIHRGLANDSCNGVIGDAWVLEALQVNNKILTPDNLSLGKSVINKMTSRICFDNKCTYSYRYDSLKGNMSADFTFNHQLWLASSLVGINGVNRDFSKNFLDSAYTETFKVRDEGLINHLYYGRSPKNIWNIIRYKKAEKNNFEKINYKERGYHLFNLFAFAKLYYEYPDHLIFNSSRFKKSLSYVDLGFFNDLAEEDNIYGCHYNVSAFELPFIFISFKHLNMIGISDFEFEKLIHDELDRYWCEDSRCFINNSVDRMTFMARAYELSYLIGD